MKFPVGFHGYPCVFDSISIDIAPGVSVIAEIHHDSDTTPEEFDCYSEEQIDAWNKDEWHYCGVKLVLDMAGSRKILGSLWGIDLHLATDEEDAKYLTDVANDLLADHRSEVADELQTMADRLRTAAQAWEKLEVSQ